MFASAPRNGYAILRPAGTVEIVASVSSDDVDTDGQAAFRRRLSMPVVGMHPYTPAMRKAV
jgi:hypothetical protein